VTAAQELFAIVAVDRRRVLDESATSVAAVRLFEMLPSHPIVTVNSAIRLLETTKPTAGNAIDALVNAKVPKEMTGRQRSCSFIYHRYLETLRVGTELGRDEK
jgi:cell filamentation protein, protein adenylyltransferase